MVLALFLRGQMISFAMGCMLLTFLVVMVLIGKENHQRMADFIRLKIEQEVLNVEPAEGHPRPDRTKCCPE